MECNIGKTERRIRVGLGIFLLGLAGLTFLPDWPALLTFVVGAVALFTGIARFCPLWKVLGINSCDHSTAGHQ